MLIKKIPNTNDLVKKIDYITKITQIEHKIPNITGLVRKNDYNANITETKNKIPCTNCTAQIEATVSTGLVKKSPVIMQLKIVKTIFYI